MKQKVVRKGRNQPTRRRFLPLFCLFKGTPLSLSLSSRKGTAESREFEGCRPRLAIFRGFNQLYNCKPSPADLVCPFIINGKKFTLFPKAKVFANWVALRKSAVLLARIIILIAPHSPFLRKPQVCGKSSALSEKRGFRMRH